MLKQNDLEAAVSEGIITPDQLDALNDFATARRQPRAFALGRDERFRLLGGFNDFFIAIGVILLAIGMMFGIGKDFSPLLLLLGVVVMWGLAEYLTGVLRLTAPSIVISCFLALFAFLAAKSFFGIAIRPGSLELGILSSLAALGVTVAHYIRFRLPFSLLVGALALLAIILALAVPVLHSLLQFDGLMSVTKSGLASWIVFVYGLGVFLVAMRFDVSDAERLTRRADSGFWLHLIAAPMIVHPLVNFLQGGGSYNPVGALIVIGLTVVFAFVALLIDRRALVVVALSYLGGAIAYGVTKVAGGSSVNSASVLVTLMFLGGVVISLGVGWRAIRGRLLRALPEFTIKKHLPPYEQTT